MTTAIGSADFNTGATAFLDAPDAPIVNAGTTPITCASWFRKENTTTRQTILQGRRGYLQVLDSGGNNRLSTRMGAADTVSTTNLSTNTWYFGAFTHPSGTADCIIYVNAVAENTQSRTSESDTNRPRVGIAGSIEQWIGQIFGLQMYSIVLTHEQISEIMHNPFSVPSGLQWMPNLWANGTGFEDLSSQQRGNSTETGSVNPSVEGPPIFLLGGQ